jgi:hypothetical protein
MPPADVNCEACNIVFILIFKITITYVIEPDCRDVVYYLVRELNAQKTRKVCQN